MKEQSHKDEMSAALRGDFKRLRERGVSTTIAPVESLEAEPVPEPVAIEPEATDEPRVASLPEPDPEPESSAGWLGRLLGR